MNWIWQTLSTLFVLQPNRYFLDKLSGFLSSVPIVGDAISGIAGHASAKNLQNDAQAHDSHMFGLQSAHAIDMFDREAKYMDKQYGRQRDLLRDSPGLQMKGLKSAGLNPILAASGGFKSPAGGSLPGVRAQASAKGSSASVASPVKMAIAENAMKGKITNAQTGLVNQQKNESVAKEMEHYSAAGLNRALAGKAQEEEALREQETLGQIYDNVHKGNLADVRDTEFGKFMAWAEVAKLDQVAAGLAVGAGVLGLSKFLGKLMYKAPNPYIKGSKRYKAFEYARKREDKL